MKTYYNESIDEKLMNKFEKMSWLIYMNYLLRYDTHISYIKGMYWTKNSE